MKNGPLNRRKFIKMGIGITVGGIIPVKGLLFSSDKDVESDFNFRGNPHEKVCRIIQRYGPEFGDLRKVLGRDNYGNL